MVDLNGIKVKNRVWLTAGAAGYGQGWPHEKPFIKLGLIDLTAFGAIITKTLPPEPRKGNYIDPFEFWGKPIWWHYFHYFSRERKKVLRKIPGGWLNNFSWWGCGIDHWIEKIYPGLQEVDVIPSIGGFTADDYINSIQKLNPLKITAIELDISCPNVEDSFALRRDMPHLFRRARTISRHPLILKIGASEDYLSLAQTAAASGFNAISAINSIPGIVITKDGVFRGGQSGKRIKETALEWILRLRKTLAVTGAAIIGGGGISSRKDCQDFFQVGADAVTLGSGFLDPIRFWRSWEPTRIAKKYSRAGG